MQANNSVARILHDLGGAAWFGGTLMGAVGLNRTAAHRPDDRERLPVASTGWDAWTPVNAAAIAAHLVGATVMTAGNRHRLFGQRGVASVATVKGAVTVAALAATAWARAVGKQMEAAADEPVSGVTEPSGATSASLARAQRQQQVLQWAVPALTGTMIALGAFMGEQQRPHNVLAGVTGRLTHHG
jgi:hypothetical protein